MGASLRDRAARPADQAQSGLGDTASVPSARSVASRLARSARQPNVRKWRRETARQTIGHLGALAAKLESLPEDKLFSSCKVQELAETRWAVMLVARERGHSLLNIGFALKIDHTTVMYGVKKARTLETREPGYAALLSCLRAASAIEARSDATGTGAAEGESAARRETPKHSSPPKASKQ
jgi:hypothetical protein